jgi:hemerythrin
MFIKTDPQDMFPHSNEETLVSWSEYYATGIELIDNQHMELVNLTNQLYRACLTSSEKAGKVFKESMGIMVDYVRFHFSAEQQLLERINYPDWQSHKKLHEYLVIQILDAANEYNAGRKFTPNNFVRALKEWVFGHIAVCDQMYASYVKEQKGKGLLTDQQIKDISESI